MLRLWNWILYVWASGHWLWALATAKIAWSNAGDCFSGAGDGAAGMFVILFISSIAGGIGGIVVRGKRRLFSSLFIAPLIIAWAAAKYSDSLPPICPG